MSKFGIACEEFDAKMKEMKENDQEPTDEDIYILRQKCLEVERTGAELGYFKVRDEAAQAEFLAP